MPKREIIVGNCPDDIYGLAPREYFLSLAGGFRACEILGSLGFGVEFEGSVEVFGDERRVGLYEGREGDPGRVVEFDFEGCGFENGKNAIFFTFFGFFEDLGGVEFFVREMQFESFLRDKERL